jgi:Asp-tRNA(Asn)/Glu-tRNA(Gln) amidotransferase A subunit family amidase
MSLSKLANATLERIATKEDQLRAFAYVDPDWVHAEVKRLDNSGKKGPLFGEVVAIKDIFDVAQMPTGCGSPIRDGRRASRDAAAVAAIRSAGGLIIGKSVTTEFACMTPGPTSNPHNADRTPGGSSSGSAAAVAEGLVSMATGTQTAGSIIRPAAFCGVVGFKPSFATISRSGLFLFGETLDTIGGFSRDVLGASRFVGVMADRPDLIAPHSIDRPKLAIWHTPDADLAEPAAIEELERVAGIAARAGADVVPFTAGSGWNSLQCAHSTIMAYEGARSLAFERIAHPDLLSDALHVYLAEGAQIDGYIYLQARLNMARETINLHNEMSGFDAILTLSAAGEAPRAETGTGNPHFNKVWTLMGGAALHLPTGTGPLGLPIGVQVYSPPQQDARAVAVALWLEATLA